MPGTIDLGRVVGDAGPGVPAGGTDGQVLVKNGSGDYQGKWETRPKTFNGQGPDATGDFKVTEIQNARQLVSDEAQQSTGEYIIRTTGGDASLSDGNGWLVRIHGRRIHTGYTPESLVMTVTAAEREEGEYAITAEIDEDVFKAAVSTSQTITLTYTTSWSANPATYGVTVTGTPVSGDVITIVYTAEVRGTITVSDPDAFVSTGWNLYDHTNGYARAVKYSDDHGFLVGGNYTLLQYSETLSGTKTEITVTDSAFTIPGDGYIWVTGGDNTTTYILMTWSDWTGGYEGSWKAYAESTVNLTSIMSSYFPYGLMQVGAVSDTIDVSFKQAISRIERMTYSAENLATAEQSGRAYEYDENYIYLVRAAAVVNDITLDGTHTACDHGLEIITGTSVPVIVETLYGKNLKEMLEHDIPNEINAIKTSIGNLQDGLAIVANGNTHAAITAGQFVYVRNHGSLSEGLYKATSNISANGTLSGSNLTADTSGGLNAINSKLRKNYGDKTLSAFQTALETENANREDGESYSFMINLTDDISPFSSGKHTGTITRSSSTRWNVFMQRSGAASCPTYLGEYTADGWSWQLITTKANLGGVASSSSKTFTTTTGGKYIVFSIGGGNGNGMWIVNSQSTGTLNITDVYTGSAISASSSESNKLTIANTGSTAPSVFAIAFSGTIA